MGFLYSPFVHVLEEQYAEIWSIFILVCLRFSIQVEGTDIRYSELG